MILKPPLTCYLWKFGVLSKPVRQSDVTVIRPTPVVAEMALRESTLCLKKSCHL